MFKIFVDGQEGTTGLRINEYLDARNDIEILKIDPEKRKDPIERKKLINNSDITFLCLPDVASKESVSFVENPNTTIIDASTAFRTSKDWTYGFPELYENYRNKIKSSKRIAVPGCHATGFISSVYPLIKLDILPKNYPITCNSITGYSGGGKSLIYNFDRSYYTHMDSPKHYALSLSHKHIPEMQTISGLEYPPVFLPIIANYYNGMVTSIPLQSRLLNKKLSAQDIHKIFEEYYKNEIFIKVLPFNDENNLQSGFLDAESCKNTNRLEILVYGHDEQTVIMARFDNLGKGASGAAIQNMNIILGCEESTGLSY